MNRQDAGKWAEAMKLASNPGADASFIARRLMIEFPEPAPLCHVCKSPLNGETCPKCQPETPQDVSALRFEGKEVEIAEPKRRKAHGRAENGGSELILDGLPYKWGSLAESNEEYWILRIKEQPPLSVYGCDPKEVDLSQLRGPRNLPVEWVDFREAEHGELFLNRRSRLVERRDVVDCPDLCVPDERRIIVREVELPPDVSGKAHGWKKVQHLDPPVKRLPKCGELCLDGGAVTEAREEWPADRPCWILREIEERKPRRFICEEIAGGRFHRFFGGEHEDVNTNALRQMAPQAAKRKTGWNPDGSAWEAAQAAKVSDMRGYDPEPHLYYARAALHAEAKMTYILRVTKRQPHPKAGERMEYNQRYPNNYPEMQDSEALMVELSEEEWTAVKKACIEASR